MTTDPRIEAAARALNTAGWTCCEGSDEPGQYDECEDCKRYCDTMARAALAAADKAATVTIEWGVRYSDSGYVSRHMSEGSARETADTHNAHDKTNWGQSFDMQVVSRTVTEWEETPDDHPTA